jgi:hypothetical protein
MEEEEKDHDDFPKLVPLCDGLVAIEARVERHVFMCYQYNELNVTESFFSRSRNIKPAGP